MVKDADSIVVYHLELGYLWKLWLGRLWQSPISNFNASRLRSCLSTTRWKERWMRSSRLSDLFLHKRVRNHIVGPVIYQNSYMGCRYIESYTNPNLTTWVDDYGQTVPRNSFLGECWNTTSRWYWNSGKVFRKFSRHDDDRWLLKFFCWCPPFRSFTRLNRIFAHNRL